MTDNFIHFSHSTLIDTQLEPDNFAIQFAKYLKNSNHAYLTGNWYLFQEYHWKPINRHQIQLEMLSFIRQYREICHLYLEGTYYGTSSYDMLKKRHLTNQHDIGCSKFQMEILEETVRILEADKDMIDFQLGLDKDYDKLVCANGVYYFSDRTLHSGDPKQKLSLSTEVLYSPTMNFDLEEAFLDFLSNLFASRDDYRLFLSQLNKALQGVVNNAVIIAGQSISGIQLFENILRWSLGEYIEFHTINDIFTKNRQLPLKLLLRRGLRVVVIHSETLADKDLGGLHILSYKYRVLPIVFTHTDSTRNSNNLQLKCPREITRDKYNVSENSYLVNPLLDTMEPKDIGAGFLQFIIYS